MIASYMYVLRRRRRYTHMYMVKSALLLHSHMSRVVNNIFIIDDSTSARVIVSFVFALLDKPRTGLHLREYITDSYAASSRGR